MSRLRVVLTMLLACAPWASIAAAGAAEPYSGDAWFAANLDELVGLYRHAGIRFARERQRIAELRQQPQLEAAQQHRLCAGRAFLGQREERALIGFEQPGMRVLARQHRDHAVCRREAALDVIGRHFSETSFIWSVNPRAMDPRCPVH